MLNYLLVAILVGHVLLGILLFPKLKKWRRTSKKIEPVEDDAFGAIRIEDSDDARKNVVEKGGINSSMKNKYIAPPSSE